MWRLIYAVIPVLQPYVWLSMARMPQWSPDRHDRFRSLAAGYFALPPVAMTIWLLLGLDLVVAFLIPIAAYFGCLVHAGLTLLSSPSTVSADDRAKLRRSLLLDIAGIYCSVFWSIAFFGLFLANVVTHDPAYGASYVPSDNQTRARDRRDVWRLALGSILWITYGGLSAALVVQLQRHGVATQQTNLVIAAAILAVPLIYHACAWMRPLPEADADTAA